jgi:DNA-binding NtrC family response regulator
MGPQKILIIEDDLLSRIALEHKLSDIGTIYTAVSSEEARAKIKLINFDIAFVDLDLDRKLEGLSLLSKLKERKIYTVVLSAREDDAVITSAYNNGCDDYLVKPFNHKSIALVFKKYEQKNLKYSLENTLNEKLHIKGSANKKIIEVIANSLLSDRPILITGETGTGKTYLAKLIKDLSGEQIPFVQVNCSEFSDSLLESELFGHEKGAFTGAIKCKRGLIEIAHDGILFLDEISTMSSTLQKKLLKVLEEKEFYPVGSEKKLRSNFRLISATCENLLDKVEKGEFRQDLYFRLEGFNIELKPLRERSDEIEEFVKYFVKNGERRIVFELNALEMLKNYYWPGNIRELEKIVDVLRSMDKGIISRADLVPFLNSKNNKKTNELKFNLEEIKKIGLSDYLENIEMYIVEEAYKANQERVRKTLVDLKLSNNTFYRIMDNVKTKKAINEHAR